VAHTPSEAQINRRGLLKLMLRMPAVRDRLQLLSANDDVLALCGAFEDASATLERLQRERTSINFTAIVEYQELCRDIEREILEICNQ
jgi:hypothetical protein